MNDCRNCKYTIMKKTKTTETPYGYCEKLKLSMIAIQENCKHFEEKVKDIPAFT